MKLLGLDLEIGNPFEEEDGSRRKPENTWLTEIGLVLYDTEFGNQPVESFECLVNEGKGVSEEAQEYTGITPELIEAYGRSPSGITSKIMSMLQRCDFVVAHNGERADKPWLKQYLLRHTGKGAFDGWTPPHWIDTLTDVEYPNNCRAKNLTYLAGFHGFCNPFPHRAGSDVLSMMKVLFNYDIDRVVSVSQSPQVIFKALAPIDIDPSKKKNAFKAGTSEWKEMEAWKKKVKKAGYRWDGDAENTGQKCWYKISREIWVEEGKEDVDFKTVRLEV